MLDWGIDYKYKVYGNYLEREGESIFLFDLNESEILIQPCLMTGTDAPTGSSGGLSPLSTSGKRIRALPQELAKKFGCDFYFHKHGVFSLDTQDEEAWKLRIQGQLFETGERLQVTGFEELKQYISEQLSPDALEKGTLENV